MTYVRKPRIYIAGPMRGYPRWNFDAFQAAAERWEKLGYVPISPAAVDLALGFDPDGPPDQVDDQFMRGVLFRDAHLLIYECDAIAMLPGWETSRGAQFEFAAASLRDLPVFDAVSGAPLVAALVVDSVAVRTM